MTPLEKLKAKPPQKIVEIDGVEFLVRASTKSGHAKLVAELTLARDKGVEAQQKTENQTLASAVLDPETGEPLMPDPNDWEEVAHPTAEALVEAFMELNKVHRLEESDTTKK